MMNVDTESRYTVEETTDHGTWYHISDMDEPAHDGVIACVPGKDTAVLLAGLLNRVDAQARLLERQAEGMERLESMIIDLQARAHSHGPWA